MPLGNDIVIGLPDKDRFNASKQRPTAMSHLRDNPSFPALAKRSSPQRKPRHSFHAPIWWPSF